MKRFLVLVCLLVAAVAVAQTTYDIGTVSFTEAELAAYQSAVATQVSRIQAIKEKAESALRFFDVLDKTLFTEAELAQIDAAKVAIRLACKRQIESLGSEPVTPELVKEGMLEKAAVGGDKGAQAELDALRGTGK